MLASIHIKGSLPGAENKKTRLYILNASCAHIGALPNDPSWEMNGRGTLMAMLMGVQKAVAQGRAGRPLAHLLFL
jgi:hypothetical protein